MSKLRAVLATAATLILGGLGIGIALNQAGVTHDMSAKEWCQAIDRVSDVQKQERFFVAYQPGNPIPQAWPEGESGRVLGACSGGTCTIAPEARPHCAYEYTYDCGPNVDGWRLCEVHAHPYVAKGWKLAAEDNAWLKWFGGLSEVIAKCQAHTTNAKCLTLLDVDNRCWLLNDGSVCRHGTQLGTGDPCPYGSVTAQMPCTVYRGAGSELHDATRVWTDEEMDEL